MQYCLLMHYQDGGEIGLTTEDITPARAAFAKYADDLDAAGVLVGTQVLQSAIANAQHKNEDVDVDQLFVSEAYVNEGPRMKRVWFRARGRADMFLKRMCHISCVVDEIGKKTEA